MAKGSSRGQIAFGPGFRLAGRLRSAHSLSAADMHPGLNERPAARPATRRQCSGCAQLARTRKRQGRGLTLANSTLSRLAVMKSVRQPSSCRGEKQARMAVGSHDTGSHHPWHYHGAMHCLPLVLLLTWAALDRYSAFALHAPRLPLFALRPPPLSPSAQCCTP